MEKSRPALVSSLPAVGYAQLPTRDIQRLPTTIFPLVLRKEYFDCPETLTQKGTFHLKLKRQLIKIMRGRFSPFLAEIMIPKKSTARFKTYR